jgi:hypothetical protein
VLRVELANAGDIGDAGEGATPSCERSRGARGCRGNTVTSEPAHHSRSFKRPARSTVGALPTTTPLCSRPAPPAAGGAGLEFTTAEGSTRPYLVTQAPSVEPALEEATADADPLAQLTADPPIALSWPSVAPPASSCLGYDGSRASTGAPPWAAWVLRQRPRRCARIAAPGRAACRRRRRTPRRSRSRPRWRRRTAPGAASPPARPCAESRRSSPTTSKRPALLAISGVRTSPVWIESTRMWSCPSSSAATLASPRTPHLLATDARARPPPSSSAEETLTIAPPCLAHRGHHRADPQILPG